jgi:hypothetical protein
MNFEPSRKTVMSQEARFAEYGGRVKVGIWFSRLKALHCIGMVQGAVAYPLPTAAH